jgi:hypothetical protein
MRRLTAIALLLAGCALPACAQRGGSHGGFSGHSGSASHSGFRSSSPMGSRIGPRSYSRSYPGSNVRPAINRYPGSPRGYGMSNRFARPAYLGTDGNHNHRPPYSSPYRNRYGYPFGASGIGYTPWLGLGYWDYPDNYASSYDDSSASSYPAAPYYDGYDPQSEQQSDPQYEQPSPDLQYEGQQPRPYYQPASSAPQPAPPPQIAVTLIFKDGRPSEQIHNYILSRGAISILDQRPRQIPIDQLDLAATVKTNREAGVDFRLPNAPGN